MNNSYLLPGLEAGPRTLAVLTERIPAEAWDRPTHPGRFSPREVIAHLADWEPRLRGRIETALQGGENLTVEVWDEGDLAQQGAYSERDWRVELSHFQTEREATIGLLRSLRPDDFERTFVHPQRGVMKVEDQAGFFLGHDLYHCDQLAEVAHT